MTTTDVKRGDLIKANYQWGDIWKPGIGYVYGEVGFFHVGLSCENGGCMNIELDKLRNVVRVETKRIW